MDTDTPKYRAVHYFEGLNEVDLPADFYSSKFYTEKLIGYIAAPSYLTVNAISPCEAPWSCIDRVIQRNAYTPGASRRTPE